MIVVTTPTGNIGRVVVNHLLAAGAPLRLILRDPARLPDDIRDRVEVIAGSHGDAEVVDRAFRGAEAVFWLCPPTPRQTPAAATVEFTRPAAEAISRHGVPHVVVATTLGRGTPWQEKAGMATASIHMADLLCTTGVALRGLALPAFMDNALLQLDAIRAGQMFGPLDPDRKLPHTATRDTGAIAAGYLLDRSWQGQQDLPVLGPQELSCNDIAAIISAVTGREIAYRQVPFDVLQARLIDSGWPRAFAAAYIEMLRAKNEGMDNAAPRQGAVIGATSFRQWVEDELVSRLAG